MFGHQYFYHSLIRKYEILVGTLFNDITIKRQTDRADPNSAVAVIRVPVRLGPKEHHILRLDADPTGNRDTALTLPLISYELTNYYPDHDRQLLTTNFVAVKDPDNANRFKHQYTPVPYNFNFAVSVMVKNKEDGLKIVEQIAYFFRPEWQVTIELIPEMDIVEDVATVLVGTDMEDLYPEGDLINRRVMIFTMNLTVKGWLYGPVTKKPYIKFSNTVFHMGNSSDPTDIAGYIRVTPGLTANGEPTTNTAESVDVLTIHVDDDYGFCVENGGVVLIE